MAMLKLKLKLKMLVVIAALALGSRVVAADGGGSGITAAALTTDGTTFGASTWTCFGSIGQNSNCPYAVVPGYEVFLDSYRGGYAYGGGPTGNGIGSLVADTEAPNSGYVFLMSWTYNCYYTPRPGPGDAYDWAHDFDPVLCPAILQCDRTTLGCPSTPGLVLPNVTCPALQYTPNPNSGGTNYGTALCYDVMQQGQNTVDWSVNGTGIWLSAFNAQDTSRAWRVRADQQFSVSVSGHTAVCVSVVQMHVVGSSVVLQCKLFVADTAQMLQSTLLVAVNKFTGAMLWSKLLAVGPVFGNGHGSGSWLTPTPAVSRGASTYVNAKTVSGGSRLNTYTFDSTYYSSMYPPRWCSATCLLDPRCTGWQFTSCNQNYCYTTTCYTYSGTLTLVDRDYNDPYSMAGLITAGAATGQRCTSQSGACTPGNTFVLTDYYNGPLTTTGCNAGVSQYFPNMYNGTYQYCCTSTSCDSSHISLCGGAACTTCAQPSQSSGSPPLMRVHKASGSVFVPDLNGGSGSVRLDAHTGAVVRAYANVTAGGAVPQWATTLFDSVTCFGAGDFNADGVATIPIVHTLVDGTTLMIGQTKDSAYRLVALNVDTGLPAWTFDIPPLTTSGAYVDGSRVVPYFFGAGNAGGVDTLYYVSYWMGSGAVCNLVVFTISKTALTYVSRYPTDNSLCSVTFAAKGGVDPLSGRFFCAGGSQYSSAGTMWTYDPVAQQVNQLGNWPASYDTLGYYAGVVFWKPVSMTVVLFGLTGGSNYGATPTQLVFVDPTSGAVIANVTGNSPSGTYMSYIGGASVANDTALIVLGTTGTANGVLQRYSEANVYNLSVSGVIRIVVIVLMVFNSVLNAFLACVKVCQFAEKHASKLPSGMANLLLGDEASSRYGSYGDSSAVRRLDLPNIILAIAVAVTLMIASAIQQNDVVTQLDSWRDDIGLRSFPQFAAAHIRPSGKVQDATYNTDVCTCTDGPCTSPNFLQTCGISNTYTCAQENIANGMCANALYGYTCTCSAGIQGCDIAAHTNYNISNTGIAAAIASGVPFADGVDGGFQACLAHYESVQQKMHNNMIGIIVVGCLCIAFELIRIASLFCWPEVFESVSMVSGLIGFGGLIATAVLTSQVQNLDLSSGYCTSAGDYQTAAGPLADPTVLPGCTYVNMGIVAAAESGLVKRIGQCVLIFVTKPIFLGLHSAFTFIQQMPHWGCCKCCGR